MKFEIQSNQLCGALSLVTMAVSARSPVIILHNVLLETSADGLLFAAIDLSTAIQHRVPGAKIFENGRTTVPGKKLSEFAKTLPSGATVKFADKNKDICMLHVECAGISSSFAGIKADDFPAIMPAQFEGNILLKGNNILELLGIVKHAASSKTDANRVFTNCINIWINMD